MKRLTAKKTPALNPVLHPVQFSWYCVVKPLRSTPR